MKKILIFFVFLCLASFSIYMPYRTVSNSNETKSIEVGPNQPYTIDSSSSLTVEPGSYTFSSDYYFELHQGNTIILSALEKPPVGESNGKYWIRDLYMTGGWTTSHWSASVYSLNTHLIKVTPANFMKVMNITLGIILALFLLFCSLGFIFWFDNSVS